MSEQGFAFERRILYVLEQIMDKKPKKGETGLMLSFGPGFSAQKVLLKF